MSGILLSFTAGGKSAFLPAFLSPSQITTSPTAANATMSLSAAGTYSTTPASVSGTWRTGSTVSADYDARFTVSSGAVSSGDVANTWLSLGTGRSWTCTKAGGVPGTVTAVGTLEIRDTATSSISATSSLTITAEVA